MARRDAALLCSAEAFPARRDEARQGALGMRGDGRGGARANASSALARPALRARTLWSVACLHVCDAALLFNLAECLL
jgi:hypothetical protein